MIPLHPPAGTAKQPGYALRERQATATSPPFHGSCHHLSTAGISHPDARVHLKNDGSVK